MADKNYVYDKAGSYVAIVDMLGYTDQKGVVQYAPRGDEVELSADEAKRLSELSPEDHVFPAIAEPGSHAALKLSQPFNAQEDPNLAAAKLRAIHEVGPVLKDPAGDSTEEAKPPGPQQPSGEPARDYEDVKGKDLNKLAKERGVKAKKAGEIRKALMEQDAAEQPAGDVTPRVGGPTSA